MHGMLPLATEWHLTFLFNTSSKKRQRIIIILPVLLHLIRTMVIKNCWPGDINYVHIFLFFSLALSPSLQFKNGKHTNNLRARIKQRQHQNSRWQRRRQNCGTLGETNHCRSVETCCVHCIRIIATLYSVLERQRYHCARTYLTARDLDIFQFAILSSLLVKMMPGDLCLTSFTYIICLSPWHSK